MKALLIITVIAIFLYCIIPFVVTMFKVTARLALIVVSACFLMAILIALPFIGKSKPEEKPFSFDTTVSTPHYEPVKQSETDEVSDPDTVGGWTKIHLSADSWSDAWNGRKFDLKYPDGVSNVKLRVMEVRQNGSEGKPSTILYPGRTDEVSIFERKHPNNPNNPIVGWKFKGDLPWVCIISP